PTTVATTLAPEPAALVPLPLAGCPPPPRARPRPSPPGWRPSVLVPEAELPAPLPPSAWVADLSPLTGKGMWVWKYRQTEQGDPDAIVARAVSAGLRQLWVRIGDSRDGFYGAEVLAGLVPRAHAAGLAVVGWGFPYLWDPVGDARWSAEALAWRGPDGDALDAFSPDIEAVSEGVALSEARARVYLGVVREAAAGPTAVVRRPVVATVYPPTEARWATYPYEAIAAYVDAFAPMVYWGCTEPGKAATESLDRLSALRPVHLIGQAFDMVETGGRAAAPSAAETLRFLDVARRRGAMGASFWVWQSIGADQWSALAAYPWSGRGAPR
ncbi:MAG TPA: hypothetical protein VE760_05475, partial [Acidimicrobiales bacterium]|nr:hypothetical protein [Acidimicrobiales bacterium]